MAAQPIQFLDPEILASIAGMELRARAVVEGFLSGLHRSPYKGFSVEFAEYRQYTPGDDPRHIDWKVYARTDRYYVKEFEEETNLACHILLDLSKSMTYASGKTSKLTYGSYLAASLAYLMFRQRDAVGLITFDDRIRTHLPARIKPGHLHSLLIALEHLTPGERTDIAAPLHQIADFLNKKGLIILISDLLDDPDRILEALQHFRFRGHEIIVFQVMDHAELTFPFHSTTRFVGLEGEGQVLTVPQSVKDQYLEKLQQHTERLRKGCGLHHIDYTVLDTKRPLDFALQEYLAARAGKL
ncbi:MAG: DUF58 domain-containing protein [candidate division KSB1 bacterium]|nr:DUF58 domain-containing protein [candidate division KSB1 bacterium]